MKKIYLALVMILAISLTLPALMNTAHAVPVTQDGTNTKYIEWTTDGYNFYTDAAGLGKGFAYQPEFLMLTVEAAVPVITPTTITVQGLDALGQPISAQVFIPGTSAVPVDQESEYVFIDPHSGIPVAFSSITNIMQQGGTDGNKFLISTVPESQLYNPLPIFAPGQQFVPAPYFEQYMGEYELSVQLQTGQGWQPGIYKWSGLNVPYWTTMGIGKAPVQQAFPFQPMLPEQITVYVNWHDQNHDLVPNDYYLGVPDDFGYVHAGTIYIEGLNQKGEKLILSHTFKAGDTPYYTFDCCGEIDKIWGGSQSDSYYIFTTAPKSVDLFYYFISIDHLTIHPQSFDILASPNDPAGTTTITVALKDVDGNLVNWGGHFANATFTRIFLSFYTSGGVINPSYNVWIPEEKSTATVTLTADTNPRTIKVVCDANVPQVNFIGSHDFHDDLNLMVWTEMTFDGVNLVQPTATWPIHTLVWGYTDAQGQSFTLNAPAEPALPPELGGPEATGIKLDGPIYEVTINLYPGCNLISSPVVPMYGPAQYTLPGIPMNELFGMTSATDSIEAIWWWNAVTKTWMNYVPTDAVGTDGPYFTDGVGYWIKAEKPCVLEISGVAMENAPFAPKEYPVHHSWNLMGFTSINPMTTASYLESLATGSDALASAVGPVWTYNAQARAWVRDPDMLWPTNAFWMNYKLPDGASLSP